MKEQAPLDVQLEALKDEQVYPFHMPGHKRRGLEEYLRSTGSADAADFRSEFDRILEMDITEVDPFDDLNHPTGELKDALERCAKLYGARESFFLVNGSTCGICAAIDAVCRPGDEILIARNSHISAYRQVVHGQLRPSYLYPQEIRVGDVTFYGAVSAQELERGLQEHPEVKAVLVVSPTYDGVISDIAALAQTVHAHGKVLIVDEAHGAHLNYIRPELSAVRAGADLVIQSTHKTLPAMTQTALLHRCSDRVGSDRLKESVACFSSTSPSYILVASLLRCLRFMERHGEEAMRAFYARLEAFYKKCEDLSAVKLFGPFWGSEAPENANPGVWYKDPSKIVILCPKRGQDTAQILRDAGIETEAATPDTVLALSSLFDREEGFERLYRVLSGIGKREPITTQIRTEEVLANERAVQACMPWEAYYMRRTEGSEFTQPGSEGTLLGSAGLAEAPELMQLGSESILLTQAVGRVSLDTVYVYPPGIPQIVCGEVITREVVEKLTDQQKSGFILRGTAQKDRITVLGK